MARALVAAGVPAVRAYELALRVGVNLAERGEEAVNLDRLEELALEVLGENEGSQAIRRLRRSEALRELDLPIIVLIGGATGTGKSTVATEVAYRLGITRAASNRLRAADDARVPEARLHALDPLLELRGAAPRRTGSARSRGSSSRRATSSSACAG